MNVTTFVPQSKRFNPATHLLSQAALTFSLPAGLIPDGHQWSLAQPCLILCCPPDSSGAL